MRPLEQYSAVLPEIKQIQRKVRSWLAKRKKPSDPSPAVSSEETLKRLKRKLEQVREIHNS